MKERAAQGPAPADLMGSVRAASTGRIRSLLREALILALTFMISPGWSAPDNISQARDYDTKAAFLHNLASFVEWPESAYADLESPFVIGIVGEDPFSQVLDNVVDGEYVGKRRIIVRRFRGSDDLAQCQLLFVASSEAAHVSEILRRVEGRPVLTVGDLAGFVGTGGMIGFGRREDDLELNVNKPAVHAAGLVVSSKLLQVAHVIEEEQPDAP
jgi:hypothetical protein